MHSFQIPGQAKCPMSRGCLSKRSFSDRIYHVEVDLPFPMLAFFPFSFDTYIILQIPGKSIGFFQFSLMTERSDTAHFGLCNLYILCAVNCAPCTTTTVAIRILLHFPWRTACFSAERPQAEPLSFRSTAGKQRREQSEKEGRCDPACRRCDSAFPDSGKSVRVDRFFYTLREQIAKPR